MNELVQLLMQKTGLSQETAQKVVTVVAEYIEGRLPAPLASAMTSYMGGGTAAAGATAGTEAEGGGMVGKAESMMASFFNQKKDEA